MPAPHSKYSYSALELEAHALADKLAKSADNRDLSLGDVRAAVEVLRKVTRRLNTLRGKVNEACIAGEIKPHLAENLLHHAD